MFLSSISLISGESCAFRAPKRLKKLLMTQDAVVEEELDHFEENGGTGAAPAGAPAMGCMGLGTGSFETARGRWSAPGQLGGPRFELWEAEKHGETGVSERLEVRSSANEIFMPLKCREAASG